MSSSQSIFVDSDVFVASVKKNDAHHQKVTQLFDFLNRQPVLFYTSNYVFAESATVISQQIDKPTARQFIEAMKSAESLFSVIFIDEQIEAKAIEIFLSQSSKNVSFVDCTNMAVMDMYHIPRIFSFDKVYPKNGYKLVQIPVK